MAELRAGDVTRAVDFYLDQDRVTAERTRDEVLAKVVDQWARDTLADRDAAMFAWRRANVAELNRLTTGLVCESSAIATWRSSGDGCAPPLGSHVTLSHRPAARPARDWSEVAVDDRSVQAHALTLFHCGALR